MMDMIEIIEKKLVSKIYCTHNRKWKITQAMHRFNTRWARS